MTPPTEPVDELQQLWQVISNDAVMYESRRRAIVHIETLATQTVIQRMQAALLRGIPVRMILRHGGGDSDAGHE